MTNRPHDFLKALPHMWGRDDEHMSKHIAVIREGRIRSILGVYPIPVDICGRPLLFATVGNAATHPYDTGKGYMSLLLNEAMKELDEIGADASRLSGLRQRYARYGYEPVGLHHTFVLTDHNVRSCRPSAPRCSPHGSRCRCPDARWTECNLLSFRKTIRLRSCQTGSNEGVFSYLDLSCQNATALAAATFSESTP